MRVFTRRDTSTVVMVVALWLVALLAVVVLAAGPVSVERVEGGIRYEASMPKPAYNAGEEVTVALAVTNTGGAPASMTFRSGQRFDLIIRRPRGDEVWRWSHDKAFIQIVQTVTVQPQETLGFTVSWDQRDFQGRRVDPGAYEAVAVFYGRIEGGRDVRLAPLPFTVLP